MHPFHPHANGYGYNNGYGQPHDKRIVPVLVLLVLFTQVVIGDNFGSDLSLDVKVHSGVHFGKQNKLSYNAFLPIYYHFDLNSVPNITEYKEPVWSPVEPEIQGSEGIRLNSDIPLDIKFNSTRVVNGYPLRLIETLNDSELKEMTFSLVLKHHFQMLNKPLPSTQYVIHDKFVTLFNGSNVYKVPISELEISLYALITSAFSYYDSYKLAVNRILNNFGFQTTGQMKPLNLDSADNIIRNNLGILRDFSVDSALQVVDSVYLIKFSPFQYKYIQSVDPTTITALKLLASVQFKLNNGNDFYFFRTVDRQQTSSNILSRKRRGLLPFIGNMLSFCCSVVSESSISTLAIDGENIKNHYDK